MTADELFALPTNDRIDRRLIRGRLVERPYPFRSPAHGRVTANLACLFLNWERSAAGAGWKAYGYGCPYRLRRDPDTVMYFDSSFVTHSLHDTVTKRSAYIDGLPTLAVEVIDAIDPADAVSELVDVSVTAGVPMFWLIDPIADTVDVYQPGEARVQLGLGDVVDASDVLPGFHCCVADLFE